MGQRRLGVPVTLRAGPGSGGGPKYRPIHRPTAISLISSAGTLAELRALDVAFLA